MKLLLKTSLDSSVFNLYSDRTTKHEFGLFCCSNEILKGFGYYQPLLINGGRTYYELSTFAKMLFEGDYVSILSLHVDEGFHEFMSEHFLDFKHIKNEFSSLNLVKNVLSWSKETITKLENKAVVPDNDVFELLVRLNVCKQLVIKNEFVFNDENNLFVSSYDFLATDTKRMIGRLTELVDEISDNIEISELPTIPPLEEVNEVVLKIRNEIYNDN